MRIYFQNVLKRYVKYKGLFLVLLITLFFGCVHRKVTFDEITMTVFCDQKYQLNSKSGEITPLDTVSNSVHYEIRFEKVKGGDSKLFGFIPIKEGHGYKAKKLIILDNDVVVVKLSINEITNSLENLENINLEEFIK